MKDKVETRATKELKKPQIPFEVAVLFWNQEFFGV